MAVLRNVEVKWCHIQKPDTSFDHRWHVTAILTPEHKAQLLKESKEIDPKGKGIKFKTNEDTGQLEYTFKRNVLRADGSSTNQAPVCCGKQGTTDVVTSLVGNGSICNIQYSFVPYDNKFGKGVTSDFKGLQVLELVPYGEVDGSEFDSEDGDNELVADTTKRPSKTKIASKVEEDEAFDDE